MRRVLAVALLAACHSSPTGPTTDSLWDLAPDGTELGIVATPRAIDLGRRALETARKLAATPDFTRFQGQIDDVVTGLLGKPDATFADAGLATDKGFAMFVTKDGVIGAIPVADRDKFLSLKHGTRGSGGSADSINGATCKPVKSLYICATAEALFARLGKAPLRGKPALAGARGDIELFAPGLDLLGGAGDLAVTAQLQPGQIEVRARWAGTPTGTLATLVAAPKVDPTGASGFAAFDVKPLLKYLPPEPIAGGVTFDQLAKALAGPITATMPGGTIDFQLHIALSDPAPVQQLIDHCDELPVDPRPTTKDGTCQLAIPEISQLGIDMWVEGKELRVGHRGTVPKGQPAALTPFGRELAAGDWTVLFWGRGSLLNTTASPPIDGSTNAHLLALICELGAGVKVDATGLQARALLRTIWTNPPALADQLAVIRPNDVAGAGSAAKALAQPGTPFAADYAAGAGGLMIPVAVTGTATSIAAMFTAREPAPLESTPSGPAPVSPPP
jgi:hypothetical protein